MEEFRDLTPTKETRKEVECCDGFAGGSVFGWLVVGSYRETILYLSSWASTSSGAFSQIEVVFPKEVLFKGQFGWLYP